MQTHLFIDGKGQRWREEDRRSWGKEGKEKTVEVVRRMHDQESLWSETETETERNIQDITRDKEKHQWRGQKSLRVKRR